MDYIIIGIGLAIQIICIWLIYNIPQRQNKKEWEKHFDILDTIDKNRKKEKE